jgi:hypothetical protein
VENNEEEQKEWALTTSPKIIAFEYS